MHRLALARRFWILAGLFFFSLSALIIFNISEDDSEREHVLPKRAYKASKIARSEYFHSLLRNPATNAVPKGIRARELQHAARIERETRFAAKQSRMAFNWFEVGPTDVGGRTRALAIDLENPNRLIAGAASGGLWESVNAGASWRPLKLDAENLSVTSIVQDPRPGQQNVWYYASGEFAGNSASDPGRIASYYGTGIYKSTDSGRTWNLLPAAHGGNEVRFDSPFDFVTRIVVSPTTGSVFVAANVVGVYRSDDGGFSFGPDLPDRNFPAPVLGGPNDHFWVDVEVNSEGRLLAALSSFGSTDSPDFEPGVYTSTDDGQTWQNVTPASFPRNHGRSVLAFAPSNPNIAYVFTTTDSEIGGREDVRLHRINMAAGTSENLSSNLPRFSEVGNINTQGGYNMAIAVKPDDENFVLLGGTNVYRARDGFTQSTVDRLDFWIGGYDAVDDDFGNYLNHHPDQHLFVFDPADSRRLWNATDGGIYLTNDVTRANEVTWSDRNSGYNVTQFYTVGIPDKAQDPRIAGGSQDNGTPFIRMDDISGESRNISVGDGAHLYLGSEYAFIGFQNGATLRLQYNAEDTPTFAGFSFIQPRAATNQLFVNPFVVDPSNEDIMYYAAGTVLWRNNQLSSLRSGQTESEGTDEGWARLTGIPSLRVRVISAMAVSKTPAHVLYYGASDSRDDNAQAPRLYRLDNADGGLGNAAINISIPEAPAGSYIADIAVNPENADEILVVMSNYEITGLYHSTNAGASFTAVEGNLEGNDVAPGPSLRAASILPFAGTTHYFIGTSTGLYTSTTLNGTSTQWIPESPDEVSQSVVTDVLSRSVDGLVAVATHGRGLYVGSQDENFNPRPLPEVHALAQNYPNPYATLTRISYDLPEPGSVDLAVFDLSGRKIADLVSGSQQETGRHQVTFNAASVTSGTYLYRLRIVSAANGSIFSETRKMMVIK